MKKIISTILAFSVMVSMVPIVNAEENDLSFEPESGYTITYPESVVSQQTEPEILYDENEPASDENYARLTNIVHKQNGADTEFSEYYDNYYTITPDDILSSYFTEEEIAQLYITNESYDCNILMRLLVCFLEGDFLPDSEKQEIIAELNNGVQIYYVLKLYNDFTMLDEETKSELDNSFLEYYQFLQQRPETYNAYDDEIESFAIENKYYTPQSNHLQVDDDSGNVQYKRTDVSIPVRNGLNMEFGIKYDLQDSYFDHYTGFSKGVKNNPLGCGWLFNVTYAQGNIITLSDGRSVSIRNSSITNYYYKDLDYYYDTEEGMYCVAHRNGTKEYFSAAVGTEFQYICKKKDKYGNIVYYNSDSSDKKKITRIYNNRNDIDINIAYYNNKTTATISDGTVINYQKTAATYNYGACENKNYTTTTYLLTNVCDASASGIHATFGYSLYDCWVYEGTSNGSVESESKAFAVMTMVDDAPSGEYYKMEYISHFGRTYTTNMPALREFSNGDSINNPKKQYSYAMLSSFDWDKSVTIDYGNGNRRITYLASDERESTLAKKSGNTYIIIEKENSTFPQNRNDIPYTVETIIYNDSGDSINRKYEYEYNYDLQPTQCIYTIDGEEINKTLYTYSSNAYKSLIKVEFMNDDSLFKRIAYTVNSLGDVTEERIGVSETTTKRITCYSYDSNNNLVETIVKDAGNNVAAKQNIEYNGYGNAVPTKVTSGNQIVTTYTYNPDNLRVTSIKDGNDNVEQFEYDSYGRVKKEKHPDDTSKNIVYEDVDNNIDVIDEKGYTLSYYYKYGQLRSLKEITTNETALLTVAFDDFGRPVSKTDALGNTTTVEYDIRNRQSKVTYPAIGSNPAGSIQVKYYDVFREGSEKYSMRMTISQENEISLEYYDKRGRLVKTAMVNNPSDLLTQEDIDTMSQLPTDTQLIVTGTYVYDAWDRLVTQADGNGRTTSYTYDIFDKVLSATKGDGSKIYTVYYEYDAAGNLKRMQQGTHTTWYTYNLAGQLVSMTDPMGYTETYTYDAAGNVTTSKDKNNKETQYVYDNRNRLISKTKSGKTISYTYDAAGNILTQTNENGTITLEYNTDGTLKKKTMPGNKEISYTYDLLKQVKTINDYFSGVTTYNYTGGGYISSITSPAVDVNYQYRKNGKLAEISSENVQTTYGYDAMGRISYVYPSDKEWITYLYDNSGNVVRKRNSDINLFTIYAYDDVNRLVTERYSTNSFNYTYTYDKYNNLTNSVTDVTKSFSYDANNRMTSINVDGFSKNGNSYDLNYVSSYDANGNMLSKDCHYRLSNSTGNYSIAYGDFVYNVWDQLIGASVDEVAGNDYHTGSYSYYADGTRKSRTARDTVNGVTTVNTYNYYYHGDTVINETRNNANYATNVIGVTGIEGRKQSGTPCFFEKDAHGDVLYAVNNGTTIANYTYNAWGDERSVDDNTWEKENPVRYNGQYLDTETGMYYLRARYYDPSINRFISEDPHWNVDNMIYGDSNLNILPNHLSILQSNNLYSYCINNPVKYSDILGKKIEDDDYDAYDNDLITTKDINTIKENTEKYEDAKIRNDYKTMNESHREVVLIRRKYNPNYADNYDYTHGGKTDYSGNVKKDNWLEPVAEAFLYGAAAIGSWVDANRAASAPYHPNNPLGPVTPTPTPPEGDITEDISTVWRDNINYGFQK